MRSVVKRKRGLDTKEGGGAPPMPKKRRRVKTVQSIMMLDNILRHTCSSQLSKFKVPRGPDDVGMGDPFSWPLLNLSTDQGPDCVAGDMMSYKLQLNLNVDYDWSRLLQNAAKQALRRFCFLGERTTGCSSIIAPVS